MKKTYFKIIFFTFLISNSHIFAQIEFPSFISSNMVLQQQTEASIWGRAEKEAEVKIKCSWDNSEYSATTNDAGKWQTKVKTPKAGGPYTITVNEQIIKNILIGEVWICSGQSNMQWGLDNTIGGSEEIEKANHPEIRLFYVARQTADRPEDDLYGNWVECTPKSARSFSAVAYYFGKKIHQELNVPVGLIHTSWGGSSAEAWVKSEILKADPDYQIYFDRQKGRELNAQPGILPLNQHSPSRLYNAMIHPLIPFALKGAIWYQGESNRGEAILYEKLFPTMIKNWRDDWQQGNFPFYFVQLAPYNYDVPIEGAMLRDAQRKTLSVPNTGMAVTMDIGNPTDIHPRNKVDVGERLALWALAKDYEKKDIVYSGPLYKSISVEEKKARIYFTHTGSGLMVKGEELTHFEIAGKNRIFYTAKAVIDGESILVESKKVNKPLAVRYAFNNTDEPNLYNKEELPASSFRTDDWQSNTETLTILSQFDISNNKFIVELKSKSKRSQIRYTTDGTVPNLQSKLYSQPLEFDGPVAISARSFVGGIGSVAIVKSELLRHKAAGRNVKYVESYSTKYAGGGDFCLVNSLRGSDNFADGFWQGFEGSNLDVIIDLGKKQSVKRVAIGALQANRSWIFFPKSVTILLSDNGEKFNKVAEITNDVSVKLEGNIQKTFEAIIEKKSGRYIKIIAENIGVIPDWHPGTGGKAWIFVDEIIVE